MFEKLKEKLKRHTKVIACAGALAAAVILGTAAGGVPVKAAEAKTVTIHMKFSSDTTAEEEKIIRAYMDKFGFTYTLNQKNKEYSPAVAVNGMDDFQVQIPAVENGSKNDGFFLKLYRDARSFMTLSKKDKDSFTYDHLTVFSGIASDKIASEYTIYVGANHLNTFQIVDELPDDADGQFSVLFSNGDITRMYDPEDNKWYGKGLDYESISLRRDAEKVLWRMGADGMSSDALNEFADQSKYSGMEVDGVTRPVSATLSQTVASAGDIKPITISEQTYANVQLYLLPNKTGETKDVTIHVKMPEDATEDQKDFFNAFIAQNHFSVTLIPSTMAPGLEPVTVHELGDVHFSVPYYDGFPIDSISIESSLLNKSDSISYNRDHDRDLKEISLKDVPSDLYYSIVPAVTPITVSSNLPSNVTADCSNFAHVEMPKYIYDKEGRAFVQTISSGDSGKTFLMSSSHIETGTFEPYSSTTPAKLEISRNEDAGGYNFAFVSTRSFETKDVTISGFTHDEDWVEAGGQHCQLTLTFGDMSDEESTYMDTFLHTPQDATLSDGQLIQYQPSGYMSWDSSSHVLTLQRNAIASRLGDSITLPLPSDVTVQASVECSCHEVDFGSNHGQMQTEIVRVEDLTNGIHYAGYDRRFVTMYYGYDLPDSLMYLHIVNFDELDEGQKEALKNTTNGDNSEKIITLDRNKTSVDLPEDAKVYITTDADGELDDKSIPTTLETAKLVSDIKSIKINLIKKGTAVSGSTTFKKILDVGENGAVPKAEFTFGITAGEAKADTKNSEYRVYAGLDSDQVTVGTAAFASSDTRDEGTTKVTKEVPVDFSKVTFPEPGIYRYILTENATTLTGIVNDENPTRILDVLVQSEDAEDGSQKCTVKSYILHKTADVIALTDADLGDDKSEGYENVYQNSSLTISKTVAGNQASHDQYFKFTLKLTGGIAGAEYRVNLDNADAAPAKNSATKYENMSNPSSFTADETGAATVDFYLQHGQSVRIDGIGKGTSYDVVEENLDYDPSTELTGDTEATNNGNEIVDTSLDADTTAAFTNTRQGTIPTGVILAMAPYLALGIAAAAGMVLYVVLKKKKESSEE